MIPYLHLLTRTAGLLAASLCVASAGNGASAAPDGDSGPAEKPVPGSASDDYIFHHWDLHEGLQPAYATEGLLRPADSRETGEAIRFWTSRGVVPQQWRGGNHAYQRWGYDTPQALAEYWTAPANKGWPGIVIDEITNDDRLRAAAGEALLRARELAPDLHIAVYVVPGINNPTFVRGLREAADRVLVEAYEHYARYDYRRIERRYQSALDHGLGDKTLIVLGVKNPWITTRRELRRQLHFVRHRFPGMPGVAFFGDTSESMKEAIRLEIARFYHRPVLRVEQLDASTVELTNIGGAAIADAALHLTASDGTAPEVRRPVGPLSPGETRTLEVGDHEPVTTFAPDYSVLAAPPAWGEEPARLRPGAESPWPSIRWSADRRLAVKPDAWTLRRDENGRPREAVAPLPPPGGAPFAIKTTFRAEKIRRYGRVRMFLADSEGPSRISLTLYRGDIESSAYWRLRAVDDRNHALREDIALPVDTGDHLALRLLHQPGVGLRVALADVNGDNIVWDTGNLPLEGDLHLDRIGFRVPTDGGGSGIEWQRKSDSLVRLTGTPGYGGAIELLVDTFHYAHGEDVAESPAPSLATPTPSRKTASAKGTRSP